MHYAKLQEKTNKWIGKKAASKSNNQLFGVPGIIESVKVHPVDETGTKFKLYFLINYGNQKLLSAEEDTVIYLDK